MAQVFRDERGVYVPALQNITLKPIQQDIYDMVNRCNAAYLLISRRVGKTTALDCIYKDKIINQGPMMKRKFTYMATHPKAGDLEAKFLDDWMLSSLGGKEMIQDSINRVWIPLPGRFEEWLFPYGDKRTINQNLAENDRKWFFGDTPEKSIIQLKGDTLYVKLFKRPVGASKTNRKNEVVLNGEYFNGAIQELVSANYNYGDYVRGKNIYGMWQEEIGTYKTNYMSQDALPAIISRDGWIISSFTPPASEDKIEPKSHWTYTQIIEPAVKEQGYSKMTLHGVDYYVYKNQGQGIPIPKKVYDEKGNYTEILEMSSVETINMVAIGSIEKCFYYGQGGVPEYQRVIGQVREEILIDFEYDKNKKFALDPDGMPKYKVRHTGKVKPGEMDMDDYLREYCVSYDGSRKDSVMPSFGDHNIKPIDWLDFDSMNSILGFDKGISEVDEAKGEIHAAKGQSVTVWAKVAKINAKQWVIYDEGVVDYSYQRFGEVWFESAKKGIPVVFDHQMLNRSPKLGSGVYNNDVYNIMQAVPQLKQSYNGGLYHKCMIPCKKRENTVKINDYNKMFDINHDLTDPLDPTQSGCTLYVTENCTNIIKFLKEDWKYKTTPEGGRKRKATREDFWDTLTYPIDTYLFDASKQRLINTIWSDPRYKMNQNRSTYMPNGFIMSNYSNRPYLIQSTF